MQFLDCFVQTQRQLESENDRFLSPRPLRNDSVASFSEAEIRKAVAVETREAMLGASAGKGQSECGRVLEPGNAVRGPGRAIAQGDSASPAGMSKELGQTWTRLGGSRGQRVRNRQNR